MFRNYITVTLRSLLRHKGYSLINVFGLATGLACCILALLFVRDELSFDRFHEDVEQIDRVTIETRFNGVRVTGGIPANPAMEVQNTLPGIEHLTFVKDNGRVSVRNGTELVYQDQFVQADSSFFDVFSFPLRRGNARTALNRPGSLVLTPSTARRLFGSDDPMGQLLVIDGEDEYVVTGILEKDPSNSHLQFAMLGSMSTYTNSDNFNQDAIVAIWRTYAKRMDAYTQDQLQMDLQNILNRYLEGKVEDWSLILESVPDIYLNPATFAASYKDLRGNLKYIYVFSAIAGLILLIACVNYTNLATARAARRAREIGVRKVAGANKSQLMRQFLSESLVFSTMSLVLSIGLTELLLPSFNELVGKDLSLLSHGDSTLVFLLIGLTVLVGFIAGGYPALVLSSYRPIEVFKGHSSGSSGLGVWLRKGLVVFQFGISAFLIFSTLIIRDQLHLIQNQNLGIDTDQVAVLTPKDQTRTQYLAFKEAILSSTGVRAVTTAPLPGATAFPFQKPNDEETLYMSAFPVDFDFADVMGLEIIQGRGFDESNPSDMDRALVVNEAAVAKMEWENPLDQELDVLDLETDGFKRMEVIGVVRDFNTSSLRQKVAAQFLFLTDQPRMGSILIKLDGNRIAETIQEIGEQWAAFEPAYPFEYSFLDEKFGEFYTAEKRLGQIFSVFAFLAVFVASLGLFGLVAFTTEQRTKEIGIRKALGSSVSGIVILMSKEFLRLVLVAAVMFTPLAYLGLRGWLNEFAYRIEIGPIHFILAGALSLIIAMATIGGQTLRAARSNPIDSLRHE